MKKLFLIFCFFYSLNLFAQISIWNGDKKIWTKGTGTEQDPYLIESAANLAKLAQNANSGINANNLKIVYENVYFKLTVDIDLNCSQTLKWLPIGYFNSTSDYFYFGGNFNGNGHKILNLKLYDVNRNTGLFGILRNSTIQNLTFDKTCNIVDNTFSDTKSVGMLAGSIISSTIKNCKNYGSINCQASFSSTTLTGNIGGLIGDASQSKVINCSNHGNILCNSPNYSNIGGIIGFGNEINYCYNTGKIEGKGSTTKSIYQQYIGGIVGRGSTIKYCYNSGLISTEKVTLLTYNSFGMIGGIIGGGSSTSINSCFNNGDIIGGKYAAGILGFSDNGKDSIQNCYNTGSISKGVILGGIHTKSANAGSGVVINNSYNTGAVLGIENYSDPIVCQVGLTKQIYYLKSCSAFRTTNVGIELTDQEMKLPDLVTFLNSKTDVWLIDEIPNINNGYPILNFTQILPTIATLDVENIKTTSAIFKGNWNLGFIEINKLGFKYNIVNENNYNYIVLNDLQFEKTVNLLSNTNYSVSAFLITVENDTIWGNTINFKTKQQPLVTTLAQTNISKNGATLLGTIIKGDDNILKQGFEFKLVSSNNFTQIICSGTNISYNINSLTESATYQYRAFAITTNDTIYGNIQTFITTSVIAPLITKENDKLISNISQNIQWYKDGIKIPNANNSIFIPKENGEYYAITLVNNLSSNPSNSIIISDFITNSIDSINQNIFNFQIINDILYIETNFIDLKYYNIYNSVGILVKNGYFVDKKIDFSSLQKGIYFIIINDEYSKKIIKY